MAVTPAQNIPCNDRATLTALLARDHHEAQVALGISQGQVIEVWATKDGSTFSILISLPNGQSCMVGHGENWQATIPAKPGRRM